MSNSYLLLDEFGIVVIDTSNCELIYAFAQAGCTLPEAKAALARNTEGVN
jgi:hypothetical protein